MFLRYPFWNDFSAVAFGLKFHHFEFFYCKKYVSSDTMVHIHCFTVQKKLWISKDTKWVFYLKISFRALFSLIKLICICCLKILWNHNFVFLKNNINKVRYQQEAAVSKSTVKKTVQRTLIQKEQMQSLRPALEISSSQLRFWLGISGILNSTCSAEKKGCSVYRGNTPKIRCSVKNISLCWW